MNAPSTVKCKFAFSKDENIIVHISQISESKRGKQCNCICPVCQKPMVAKMGDKRAHHFAHYESIDDLSCNLQKINETSLHKLAKQIIQKNKKIKYPAYYIPGYRDEKRNKSDKLQSAEFECFKENYYPYSYAYLEKSQGDFTPDVVIDDEKLFIEITVTHSIDQDKRKK